MNSAILHLWNGKIKRQAGRAVIAGLALLLAASGAAGGGTQKEEGPAARLSEAPHSARALRNPFAGNEPAKVARHKLFEQHYASCHGGDGDGLGHDPNL